MLSIFYVCESIRPILNCFNRAIVKQITHPMMIEILHAQSNCKHLGPNIRNGYGGLAR